MALSQDIQTLKLKHGLQSTYALPKVQHQTTGSLTTSKTMPAAQTSGRQDTITFVELQIHSPLPVVCQIICCLNIICVNCFRAVEPRSAATRMRRGRRGWQPVPYNARTHRNLQFFIPRQCRQQPACQHKKLYLETVITYSDAWKGKHSSRCIWDAERRIKEKVKGSIC